MENINVLDIFVKKLQRIVSERYNVSITEEMNDENKIIVSLIIKDIDEDKIVHFVKYRFNLNNYSTNIFINSFRTTFIEICSRTLIMCETNVNEEVQITNLADLV